MGEKKVPWLAVFSALGGAATLATVAAVLLYYKLVGTYTLGNWSKDSNNVRACTPTTNPLDHNRMQSIKPVKGANLFKFPLDVEAVSHQRPGGPVPVVTISLTVNDIFASNITGDSQIDDANGQVEGWFRANTIFWENPAKECWIRR